MQRVGRMTTMFDEQVFESVWDITSGPPETYLCDCLRLGLDQNALFHFGYRNSLVFIINGITLCLQQRLIIRATKGKLRFVMDFDPNKRKGRIGLYPQGYVEKEEEPGNITVLRTPTRELLFDSFRLRRSANLVLFNPRERNGLHDDLFVSSIDFLHPGFEGSWLVRGKLRNSGESVVFHCFTEYRSGVMKVVEE